MCAIGRQKNTNKPIQTPAAAIVDAIPTGNDGRSSKPNSSVTNFGENLAQNLGSNKQKLTASDNYQG